MGKISKSFALILILITATSILSLLVTKSAFAQRPTPQPIPTPSVPTFTVQPVGPPTIANTTYSLDPNTGQIVADVGYTNEYSLVNVTIKNQHLTLGSGNTFYYNVQVKIHNNSTMPWIDLILPADMNYPTQSNSDYTILSFSIGGPSVVSLNARFDAYGVNIGDGARIDFQVQALAGYFGPSGGVPHFVTGVSTEFYGETSAWSNTETITLPADIPLSASPASESSTSTLTPTPISTVSRAAYASLLLVALVVIAFLLAVIIFLLLQLRKHKTTNSSQ